MRCVVHIIFQTSCLFEVHATIITLFTILLSVILCANNAIGIISWLLFTTYDDEFYIK